jgi:hypothetical protein
MSGPPTCRNHDRSHCESQRALTDVLYEASTPGHSKFVPHYSASRMCSCVPLPHCRYRRHLSKVHVAELVTPHTNMLELVGSWLEYNGVSSFMVSMTHGGSRLTVSGVQLSQANDILGASYQLYQHTTANTTVLRTISYRLPAELHAHVQTAVPTTYFGSPPTPWQTPTQRQGSRGVGRRAGTTTFCRHSCAGCTTRWVTFPPRRAGTCSGLGSWFIVPPTEVTQGPARA